MPVHPDTAKIICQTDAFLRKQFGLVYLFSSVPWSPCQWGVGGALPPKRKGLRVWVVTKGGPNWTNFDNTKEGEPIGWVVTALRHPMAGGEIFLEEGLESLGKFIQELAQELEISI